MIVGVISDTHGLLRPEAVAALRDAQVAHILHAGDVGNFEIIEALRLIAAVTAIRGNIDRHGACAELPATDAVELAGALFYLIHSASDLDIDPVAAQVSAVVSGHSHQAGVETRNNVLFLNPGSAGPRRFKLPVTLALIEIEDELLKSTILTLL